MLEQFLSAMDDEKEYDFIAHYYTEFSKFDLRTILLEYIYASHTQGKEIEDDIRENVREELEDHTCNL